MKYKKGFLEIRNCALCNKQFEINKFQVSKKYCSNSCTQKGNYHIKKDNRPKISKNCIYCNNHFVTTNKQKMYCSRQCLQKECNDKRRKKYNKEKETKKCIQCKEILGKHRSKFCSDNCRKEHYTPLHKRKCIICNKYFETRSHKLTCSNPCKIKHRRNVGRINDKRVHRRIRKNINSRIYQYLKYGKEGKKLTNLLGYSIHDLKEHLENQFDAYMSWDNYGTYWHIDHIIPHSFFRLKSVNDYQFKLCWSLVNLQPLEAKKNIKKRDKIFE